MAKRRPEGSSLIHRFDGLPRLGPVERLRPRLAARPAVRLSGLCRHGEGICFRAEGGGLTPGIYFEPPSGEAVLWFADSGERLHAPRSLGERLAIAAGLPGSSAPAAFLVGAPGEAMVRVPGQSLGHSPAHNWVAVADLAAGRLWAHEVAGGEVRDVAEVALAMDPLLAPLVSVSDEGMALLMDARVERCDAGLVRVDLRSGAVARLVRPLPAPSWITAVGAGRSIVALFQRLGEAPTARLLRLAPQAAPVELVSLPLAQPAHLPLLLNRRWAVSTLSLAPFPLATHGPADLVAVPLEGGAVVPLTRAGELSGRLRAEPDALWLEGGAELMRFPLLADD